MSLFLRQQLSPYCVTVEVVRRYPGGLNYRDEVIVPAMHYAGPVPHGRSAHTGQPSDWRPDAYGYTDRDDYHLAIYGA